MPKFSHFTGKALAVLNPLPVLSILYCIFFPFGMQSFCNISNEFQYFQFLNQSCNLNLFSRI